ncbi:hypothetical protein [Thermococcus sp.]
MQIIELDFEIPYDGRGKILRGIIDKVRGKIRDIHFFPPTSSGISEIKIEVETEAENVKKLIKELKNVIKEGKISVKIISDA